jgi:AraC family transcriptional regulator
MSDSHDLLSLVERYLDDCKAGRTQPRSDELARFLNLSRTTLCDYFNRYVGEPPSAFLKRAHLRFMKVLLLESKGPVRALAEKAGFDEERSFFRSFRRLAGMTPGEFRAMVQSDKVSLPHD